MSTHSIAVTQEDLERLVDGHLARYMPEEAVARMISLVPLKLLPLRIGKPSVGAARNFLRALGVPVIRVNHKEQFVDLNVLEAAIRAHEVAVPAARKPVLRREAVTV